MIKEWLEEYEPKTQAEVEQALREIMQEIALAGLQRSGFFEKAAFYGGTALRLFYGLDRFSEDLDFSLLEVNPDFSLKPYLEGIITEFSALGMQVSVKEKVKTKQTNIDSAFLKSDTVWKELIVEGVVPQAGIGIRPSLQIKIEVDTHPPLGFETEEKLLLKPFSFYVKCFKLPDLFAGKMHALIFRKWKQRVKGRDWYDMEWYIKKGVPLHLDHFLLRTRNSGDWDEKTITQNKFIQLIEDKITNVSFKAIREDIVRFIRDDKALEIWSADYFGDLIEKIKFK
ncbi:MAG: nucleotidyl transferase AbiEii/AbiGii toxin family protein [Cytophagales bacterium]|jgi:predicted nucleotidyltransferase component of viral defense system|nr:nucleotidyl transferase AbiEii/AbiGii toxin family protein [Cytophagales bacterium]MCA6386582.1 nucleotidyl transferase AbiEii/AbiGii toxin family protein [Cytophagales bacterium]MCA6389908.1 nucleotidyl transferase AbiEii/AbiGii toxin family protein [Cytophagales bacterium]MCA6395214.1 nucleotidyl transferase AbiEii/AbiGii toxin family protein [Cytophagales bacterium]MCA6398662.1 nucleotidyl transferase AbiEii/AbiGii toxin family protein [Cytophagales bacterium]